MLRMIKSSPNAIKGMPIGAVTTSTVRTMPTIIKASPSTPAINLPVKLRIVLNKVHKATKGHARQEVDFFIRTFSFSLIPVRI